jgi:hypothetical protein
MPSRNVPVICHLCPIPPGRYPTYPAVWHYNMGQHLRDIHPEYVSPLQPGGDLLPFKLWQSVQIDKEEEMALGVPMPRPFTNFVRDSDEPTRGESEGRDLANGAGRNGSAVDAEASVRTYYKRAFKTPNRSRDKTLPSVIIDDVPPPSFVTDLIGWPLRRYWASGMGQASRVNPAK